MQDWEHRNGLRMIFCGIENFMTGIYTFTTGGTSHCQRAPHEFPVNLELGVRHASLRVRPIAHSVHDARETSRTVRVGEQAVGRIHAMCLSVRALRDPAFIIERRACFVSKESTDTTDGK